MKEIRAGEDDNAISANDAKQHRQDIALVGFFALLLLSEKMLYKPNNIFGQCQIRYPITTLCLTSNAGWTHHHDGFLSKLWHAESVILLYTRKLTIHEI